MGAVFIAVLLMLLLPIKTLLYFLIFTRFNLRARTSLLASCSLANYSEFGLIVGAVGVETGLLEGKWLVVIAIALSISFVLGATFTALTLPVSLTIPSHMDMKLLQLKRVLQHRIVRSPRTRLLALFLPMSNAFWLRLAVGNLVKQYLDMANRRQP